MKVISGGAMLAGALTALVGASAASAALATLPGVAGDGPATPGRNPRVRPPTILYTGDGSGFFAGAHHHGTSFAHLRWSRWSKTLATGSGDDWINDCSPDCALGHFHGYPVRLKLWSPKVIEGYEVFTRMNVTYTGRRPGFVHRRTQTWKVGHAGWVFFWRFPS